jgi:hypothetical protein
MTATRTRPIVVGCCAVAALGGAVRAQPQVCHYRSRETGNWNAVSTWNCWDGGDWTPCATINEACQGTFPETGDTATIAPTHTVSVVNGRSEYVYFLTIEDDTSSPGTLALNSASSSSSLTIENDLSMHISGSPGKIVFEDGGTTTSPGELIIDSDMTAAGVIETSATAAGGKITVTGSNTLTVSGDLNIADGGLTVDGSVLISTDAEVAVTGGGLTFQDEFENDGTFTISGSNTILVEFQGGIAASSNGDWVINNSNATFKLVTTNTNITATGGDIALQAGTIDADASFQFGGTMTWSGNETVIDVAANKVFHATSSGT